MRLSDTIVVGLISAGALIVGNLIIGWIQLKRALSQNQVDDADAATAYAKLNKDLRKEMEGMQVRLQSLENMRVGPYRITTDIAISPDPHILRNEIVLMTADPIVSHPSDKEG